MKTEKIEMKRKIIIELLALANESKDFKSFKDALSILIDDLGQIADKIEVEEIEPDIEYNNPVLKYIT